MSVRGICCEASAFLFVRMNICNERNQPGQPPDTGTNECVECMEMCRRVCVRLLHSVTCSISCRAASPCNESALEGMFPQITKLLTAQAGATELFPQPGDCVGVISGL